MGGCARDGVEVSQARRNIAVISLSSHAGVLSFDTARVDLCAAFDAAMAMRCAAHSTPDAISAAGDAEFITLFFCLHADRAGTRRAQEIAAEGARADFKDAAPKAAISASMRRSCDAAFSRDLQAELASASPTQLCSFCRHRCITSYDYLFLHYSPEMRYQRWLYDARACFPFYATHGYPVLKSSPAVMTAASRARRYESATGEMRARGFGNDDILTRRVYRRYSLTHIAEWALPRDADAAIPCRPPCRKNNAKLQNVAKCR